MVIWYFKAQASCIYIVVEQLYNVNEVIYVIENKFMFLHQFILKGANALPRHHNRVEHGGAFSSFRAVEHFRGGRQNGQLAYLFFYKIISLNDVFDKEWQVYLN